MIFYFILVPSSQCFIDPAPPKCERSKNGLPYPRIADFARSLLVLENMSNLADFVDGMDLGKEWGETNINFEELQKEGAESYRVHNPELEARNLCRFNTNRDYRETWYRIVESKPRRIQPMKQGRYKTRWRRIRNDKDPRERDR